MALTKAELEGLDLLLNESVLLDAELDPARRLLGLTFYVEMIPEHGERAIEDLYLQLLLRRVGRLAVSLRFGSSWSADDARVEKLQVEGLSSALARIRYHDAIYGWSFLDVPDEEGFADWRDRLSLDFRSEGGDESEHTLTVWNEELVVGREEEERLFFDLRAWFEDVSIRDRLGRPVELEQAIAAGRRYWAAVAGRGSGGPSPYPVPRRQIPLPRA